MFRGLFGHKKIKRDDLNPNKIPQHVAIIMDGNGRWAKRRGLPRNVGHQRGVQVLKKICYACGDLGISYLSVYAFSTENWHRPESEVNFLMGLFKKTFNEWSAELIEKKIKVLFLGRRAGIAPDLLEMMDELEMMTRDNKNFNLNICFNYGSRAEIVDAINEILSLKEIPQEIDEEYLGQFLYTRGIPDVELIIRTSGEQRLSNFLLYQSAYAEFVFTPVYWPDFSKDDLIKAICEFQNRDRRFGRI